MYDSFAKIYDSFMDNIDYRSWAEQILKMLVHHGIKDGLLLDLACGTGTMTELLATAGYDCIGVDGSADMLQEALEKRDSSGHDILYLEQDMTEFELYGTVRAVVCTCDSLNYLTSEEELLTVFRLVNNYLDPNGIFLFDFNTENVYAAIGSDTIAESREEGSFIWENDYDPETGINEYCLTLFIPEQTSDEESGAGCLYSRHTELHVQKAWSLAKIQKLLEKAGLIFENAYDGYTDAPANEMSERILVCAREHGKHNTQKGK